MKFLRIPLLLLLFGCCWQSCRNPLSHKPEAEIPAMASWIKPEFSSLFTLAATAEDTFLILKDPADTAKTLGCFVWGKGQAQYPHFTRLGAGRKMVLTTAVFVGMVEALHRQNLIIGVDNGDYITSPKTLKAIQSGQIASVAKSGELSQEAVARLKPDLLIGYYIEPKGKENLLHARRNNTAVLFFQNFLEKHPLGRAEWIKVFGYLTGTAAQAVQQFEEIKEHYLSTAATGAQAKTHPTVLINAPFTGTWDIPSGDSYMSKLISDAGGQYLWKSEPGAGRIPMDIEKVFSHAQNAELWINPGACEDLPCLKSIDPRLEKFAAFKTGNIYNSTKTLNAKGANQYWEYGVVRPDLVLQDLVQIMHPEISYEQPLIFFEKLNP